MFDVFTEDVTKLKRVRDLINHIDNDPSTVDLGECRELLTDFKEHLELILVLVGKEVPQ